MQSKKIHTELAGRLQAQRGMVRLIVEEPLISLLFPEFSALTYQV